MSNTLKIMIILFFRVFLTVFPIVLSTNGHQNTLEKRKKRMVIKIKYNFHE